MHSETDDPNIPSERQSFLKLTRNIATLPLEQSTAALETGAAIAGVSLPPATKCFIELHQALVDHLHPVELAVGHLAHVGSAHRVSDGTWTSPAMIWWRTYRITSGPDAAGPISASGVQF